MEKISKEMRERLPETIEGLREFIDQATREITKTSRMIQAAELLIREKKGGAKV